MKPASGRKNITITPFHTPITRESGYEVKSWATLKTAVQKILSRNISELSYEEVYRLAYNMVLQKHGEFLYKSLKDELEAHLKKVAQQINECSDNDFLQQLSRNWLDHKISQGSLKDVFMYMDRIYVVEANLPSVYDLGCRLFKINVARNANIQPRMLASLLGMIERERNGEIVDSFLIKSLTSMLVELGMDRSIYREDFESHFIRATQSFYGQESAFFLSRNGASEYLKKVETRIAEEMDRLNSCLDAVTETKLREVLNQVLIVNHIHAVIGMEGSGLMMMLRDNRTDDLSRLYRLCLRIEPAMKAVREDMSKIVRTDGQAVVEDPENIKDPVLYINTLLQLKDKYDNIVAVPFRRDKSFQISLQQAFEYFMNLEVADVKPAPPTAAATAGATTTATTTATTSGPVIKVNHAAEYLSLFIDDQLKRGTKGSSDDKIEESIEKAMLLFRYLQDKDVFEKHYKNHLAKRLIGNRSVSDDAERSMIARLKTECGFQYTVKLEGMFKDMKVSADSMELFKKHLQSSSKASSASAAPASPPSASTGLSSSAATKNMELYCNVLTTTYWPLSQSPNCQLPMELRQACDVFTKFYNNQHTGRRLSWQLNKGSADLIAYFDHGKRKHELNTSTFQMIILLLFNSKDKMSYHEIFEKVNNNNGAAATADSSNTKSKKETTTTPTAAASATIDEVQKKNLLVSELKRNLQSLSVAKVKVLIKEPLSREIDENDTFEFNEAFESKLVRVKIGTVSAAASKETEHEQAETRQKVDEDRKHQIEAAIVRVMKSRKVMEHNDLVAEVTKQLSVRFMSNPTLIKKRIESLIERDYLERSAANVKQYKYLA